MKRSLAVVVVLMSMPASAAVDNDPSTAACTVKGKGSIVVQLFATPTGGTALLTLSAHERNIEVLELPADSQIGRIRVSAKRDVPGIRVEGYIPGKGLAFSSTKEQTVVSDHVWIRAGAQLKLLQSQTQLQVEPLHSPIANVRTRVQCGDLRLGAFGSAPAPKAGEPFYFKSKSTPLLDGPGGKPVFTIELLLNPVWVTVTSSQKQGAFRRIELSDDVRVVGWVRVADLEEEHGGGGMGGLGMTGTIGSGSSAPMRTAKLDAEIYLGPSSTGQVVGVLEKGAKVYGNPVGNGFSTITFVDGDATPPDGKQFHVLTQSLQ